MKKIYISILSLTISMGAFAQQQPNNSDFENWDGNEDPTGWNDMRTGDLCGLCEFGSSQRIFEDNSVVYSGNASVRIESTDAFGNVVNGTMTTGKVHAPSTTPSEGFAQTHTAEADFNRPMTDMPDTLVFYAQYNQTGTTDSAAVSVILHDNNNYRDPNGDNNQVIGEARKRFQTGGIGSWMKISVPFEYSGGSTNSIAYALMTFTSSYQPGQGSASSKLWVDNFNFIYNITPVLSSSTVDVSTFTAGSLNVDYSTGGTPLADTDFVVELSDENGSFVPPVEIGTEYNTSLTSGTITCTVPEGTIAGAGYKVRVTNVSEYYASIEVPLTITNLTVGIAGISNDNIRVYGTNGNVNIDLTNSGLAQASYELISLNGQRVATGSLVSGSINTLSNLNTGIYAVRVIHTEGMFTSKVLVN
jgi:hypothetical protein